MAEQIKVENPQTKEVETFEKPEDMSEQDFMKSVSDYFNTEKEAR